MPRCAAPCAWPACTPGDRVLEIGCGWGALAEMATTEFEASITGVTLSTEQLAFAQARMGTLGTQKHAELRLQDYRDIKDAPFDAICSIEMVEAVGREYWPTYFQTVHRLLKPGGQACIQSIVIDDALLDRYIAVHRLHPAVHLSRAAACPARASSVAKPPRRGCRWSTNSPLAPTTPRRCAAGASSSWRAASRSCSRASTRRFMHTWEFYLAYCEAAFAEANIDVVQYTLVRP